MQKIADALRSRGAYYLQAWNLQDPDNENPVDLIKSEIYNEIADIIETTPDKMEPISGTFEGTEEPQKKYSKKGYQSYQAKSEM